MSLKEIPNFKSEAEERDFWLSHDSTEYMDWDKAESAAFPNLKPTTKTISLRLSETMLNQLRMLANRWDVSYQALIKIFLMERIAQEYGSSPHFRQDEIPHTQPSKIGEQ